MEKGKVMQTHHNPRSNMEGYLIGIFQKRHHANSIGKPAEPGVVWEHILRPLRLLHQESAVSCQAYQEQDYQPAKNREWPV